MTGLQVKCDETKPSCLKCSTTGRTCDGYVESSARAGGGKTPVSTQLAIVGLRNEDRRAFEFFVEW
jgi:hypothetical protein